MAATYNGHADIRGIGSGCTVAMGGYAQVMMDSLPVVHRATVTEHIGVNGETCSIVHTNHYFEINISFRPMSATSVAEAQTDAMFLPKGSTVVLSGFSPISIGVPPADILNGTPGWLLVGDVTVTRNSNEPATVDMTLRKYAAPGVQPTLLNQIV